MEEVQDPCDEFGRLLVAVVGVLHHNTYQVVEEVPGGIGWESGIGEQDHSQTVQSLILQVGGKCNTNGTHGRHYNTRTTTKTILHALRKPMPTT